MKTIRLTLSAIALVLVLINPSVGETTHPAGKKTENKAAGTILPVNTSASVINWNAKKVGGEHNGTLKIASGSLLVKGNKLAGGDFIMEMTTISDNDGSAKLMGHLKSEDFFSVEKNPNSTFKITKATPIAGAKAGEVNYNITGDLTIKGTTHPISFPATVKINGNAAEATAKVVVDRLKYDIKYRAAIIGTAADKIIEDTFSLDVKLVAGTNKMASAK
ncbi:YceI family protein [Adhaeribacter aquaticus]|uniref:YceI family protein n=1 Tax=Adhaeribacter aquaticus TaxID=299567 RepID=UPI00040FE836|nr:YceI family protein [Adhaeribacter aquaticus]